MRSILVSIVILLLSACGESRVADPYDPARMDLKPVPAKVMAERLIMWLMLLWMNLYY